MSSDLFIHLIQNTLLLISISVFYSLFPYYGKIPRVFQSIIFGLLISIVGVVIMSTPFAFGNGVFFDTRSILMSSAGMFFGFLPTLIASLILIGYRIFLGGSGALTGVLVVLASGLIGLLWRKYRLKANKVIKAYDFIGVGFVVHVVMLLLMFTLPGTLAMTVVKELWIAILFIYPIGSFIVYQFMMYHRLDFFQKILTRESETQYRSIFEESKVSLMLLDAKTGNIVDVNKTATDFYGWSREKMTTMNIKDINTSTPEEVDEAIRQCILHNKNYFHFKHRIANGKAIDVEIYSGPITILEKDYLLSTIHDITERIESDKQIALKQEEIQYISHHDFLTGLYNRYFFEVELSRLNTARQLPLTIIMGDVNGLKLVNDAFSHLDGDQLLIEISKILKKATRSEDIVARWGGDEFVILLPQTPSENAEPIISRVKQYSLESSYPHLIPSISMGVATKTKMSEDIFDILKSAEEAMYRSKLVEGKSMRNSLISTLESTLIEKSFETKEHASSMVQMSTIFANKMKLNDDHTSSLALLSRLHDIGKIAISDSILRKVEPLTTEEWEIMKEHSKTGARIVSTIPELQHLTEGILHHHEWFDGTGYPDQLKGENIPLLSRMISIVDAYEVMTNGRVYKPKVSHEEAIQELEKCSFTQFDPQLVEIFKTLF